MHTLVLQGVATSVKLEANHLVVHDHALPSMTPVRVPLVDVNRVIVVGQPAISFPALTKLMDLRIPCSFLSHNGRWRGVLDTDPGYHAERRMWQYARVSDRSFALSCARRTIVAKVMNARRTLQRMAANRKIDVTAIPGYADLSRGVAAMGIVKTIDALRGLEGCCAVSYFRGLSIFFPGEIPFEARSRRPPRNAANALLSFLYTLIMVDMVGMVRAHGLDVAAGYFHHGGDRSPALALDLMEPFRPSVADRLVLDLLNHRRLTVEEHFEHHDDDGGTYLNAKGRATVFRAYDEVMRRSSETRHGRLTVRQQMEKTVCDFLKVLENKEEAEMPCSSSGEEP